ncbi:MAG TPA: hypothetical protein VGL02_29775 [Streptomyces sp.]
MAHAVDDDAMLLWLNDRGKAATDFTKKYLLAQTGTGPPGVAATRAPPAPSPRSGRPGTYWTRPCAARPRSPSCHGPAFHER